MSIICHFQELENVIGTSFGSQSAQRDIYNVQHISCSLISGTYLSDEFYCSNTEQLEDVTDSSGSGTLNPSDS